MSVVEMPSCVEGNGGVVRGRVLVVHLALNLIEKERS